MPIRTLLIGVIIFFLLVSAGFFLHYPNKSQIPVVNVDGTIEYVLQNPEPTPDYISRFSIRRVSADQPSKYEECIEINPRWVEQNIDVNHPDTIKTDGERKSEA